MSRCVLKSLGAEGQFGTAPEGVGSGEVNRVPNRSKSDAVSFPVLSSGCGQGRPGSLETSMDSPPVNATSGNISALNAGRLGGLKATRTKPTAKLAPSTGQRAADGQNPRH